MYGSEDRRKGTLVKDRIASVMLIVAISACGANGADEALEGTRELSLAPCDPATGTFTLEVTNPYLPLLPGRQLVLEGKDGSKSARVQITVLDEIEVVAGVDTRVVEEREWIDDELVEVSRNFVAQAADGSVCYFGEAVDDYRDGEVVGHGGEWRAGENGARPGILMPGDPEVGTSHKQEVAPGVAEDASVVKAIGRPFTVPAGTFDDTLETRDVDPIGGGVDPKRYARGVGLIVDEGLELTSYRS
jgi:hypothetical protein